MRYKSTAHVINKRSKSKRTISSPSPMNEKFARSSISIFARTRMERRKMKFIRIEQRGKKRRKEIHRHRYPSIKLNLARIVIKPLPEILLPPYNTCTAWNSVQTARRIFILPPKVVKGTAASSNDRSSRRNSTLIFRAFREESRIDTKNIWIPINRRGITILL